MKPKHTPSPWRVETEVENGTTKQMLIGGEKSYVAIIGPRHISQESQANARLIAAAPEMLETLEALSALLSSQAFSAPVSNLSDEDHKPIEMLRDALAKARGES